MAIKQKQQKKQKTLVEKDGSEIQLDRRVKNMSVNTKRGFSLLELLIVIVIIAVMSGALFANVGSRKSTSEVEIAALQVVANLRALQNDAINGRLIGSAPVCMLNFHPSNMSSVEPVNTKKYLFAYRTCADMVNATPTINYQIGGFLTSNRDRSNVTATFTPTSGISFFSPRGDANSGFIKLSTATENYYVCVSVGGTVDGSVTGAANIYAKKTGCP